MNTTGRCHLLALPRELRDSIIQHTVTDDLYPTQITMYCGDVDDFKQPSLAQVNRQLRAETLPIYYGQKTFQLNSLNYDEQWELAKKWFNAIQPHLHMIKKVEMSLCDEHLIMLEIQAAPGNKPNFKVYVNQYGATAASLIMCASGIALKRVEGEMQEICESVAYEGFKPEQYIRVGELFLCEEYRCDPYGSDSDDEGDYEDFELDDWDSLSEEEVVDSDEETEVEEEDEEDSDGESDEDMESEAD